MKKYLGVIAIIGLLGSGTINAQATNYVDWNLAGKPSLGSGQPVGQPGMVANAVLPGGITTYVDLVSFQTATTTVFEDFENSPVPPAGVLSCIEPVNSLSNGPCYVPGGLIPGFNVTSSGGGGVVTLGAGLLGAGHVSTIIGANTFVETTNVSFDAADVTAIAFDVLTNGTGPVTITLLDSIGGTIGTIALGAVATATPVFVGFSSITPVASLIISDDGGSGELIDDLYFGALGGALGPPLGIPTLTMTGLISLLLLVTIFAWRFRRTSLR